MKNLFRFLIFASFLFTALKFTNAQWVQTNGPYGGSIGAFAISPDGTKIFTGTWGGGIFLSTNKGTNWTYRGLSNAGIKSLAISPDGTKIFAGCSAWMSGVFLSTDNGLNWVAVNNGLQSNSVGSLAISPDGTKIFAGTEGGGIFLSTNNGTSWTAVNNGLTNMSINTITINQDGTKIFVGTLGGGIFLSIDNGSNWTAVNNGLTNSYVYSLAVSPNGTNIFAVVSPDRAIIGGEPWNSELFHSTDNGSIWSAVDMGFTNVQITSLAFSPDGTIIYAGTWWNRGIFLSTNNGVSWSVANDGFITTYFQPPNIGTLAVAPNGTDVFVGTHGNGIFLSTNQGTNWTKANNGLMNIGVQSFAFIPNEINILVGTDGEGIFLSNNNGENWTESNNGLTGGSVTSFAMNLDGAHIFASTSGWGSGVYLSNDNGTSWTAVDNGLTNKSVSSLAAAGINLFAGTDGEGVFLSTDNGSFWTAVNSGLSNKYVSSLKITSDGMDIFAGTRGGGVFHFTNDSQSWTEINNGLPNKFINSIIINADGSKIFAAVSGGGIFLSTNKGVSWNAVNNGLPNTDIRSLAITPDGMKIFAGTFYSGIYFSTDNGSHWIQVNNGLDNFLINTLAINPDGTTIFASTAGGVRYRPLSEFNFATLLTPTQDQYQVNPVTTFTWEAYTGASSYTLEINTGKDFTNPQYSYTTANTTFTVPQALNENSQYCWRVKADNSQWSDIWNFITGISPIPRLLEPKNGYAEVPANNAFLSWSWINEATNFRVELSEDPSFSSLYYQREENNTQVWNLNLSEGMTYYWRVRSFVNDVWSDWSEVRNFTVHTVNITTLPYKFASYDVRQNQDKYTTFRGALVGDVRGDGIKRLVVGNGLAGKLMFYRYENDALVKEDEITVMANPADWASVVPKAIGDLNNDGQNEIVVTAEGFDGNWQPPIFGIYRWNGTVYEKIYERQEQNFNVDYISTVEITDIDKDGSKELVMVVNGLVGVYDYTSNTLTKVWEYNQPTDRQFAIGDTDGDGSNEIVMSSRSYPEWEPKSIYIVGYNGSTYQEESTLSGFEYALGGIAIEDLNNDGVGEIITGTGYVQVYTYKTYIVGYNGNEYSVVRNDRVQFGAIKGKVGDIDGDGKNEVVLFRNANGSYVYDFENGQYNLGLVEHNGTAENGDVRDIDNDNIAEIIAPAYQSLDIVSIYDQNPKVLLLAPSQDQYQVTPVTTFSWQPYAGATSYTLQINTGKDFTNPQYSYTTANTSFTVPQALNENSQYCWRVKADNSQWSDIWNFITGMSPIPRLLEPKNGYAEVPANNAFLRWNWVDNATSYRVEVSADPNFSSIFFEQENNNTMIWLPSLSEGMTYYWKVKAYSNNVWSDWSEVRSFNVHTIQINIPQYKYSSFDISQKADANTSFRGALVGDIRGDGVKRLVVGNGKAGKLVIYRYENNALVKEDEITVMTNPAEWSNVAPKAIEDINNDGQNEIVVMADGFGGEWQPPIFQIYRWNGTVYEKIFERQENNFNVSSYNSLEVTDIDKDGSKELVMAVNNRVGVYDYISNSLNKIWEYNQLIDGQFAIGDTDGDGSNEIVMSSQSYPEWEPKSIYIVGYNGTTYQEESTLGGFEYGFGGVTIEDLNNDGVREIIIGTCSSQIYNYNLYIINYNGSGYAINRTDRVQYGENKVTVGDIDGDGKNEVVLFRSANGSYVYDYENGNYNLGFVEHGGTTGNGDVRDIDNDNIAEIIAPAHQSLDIVSIYGQNPKVVLLTPSQNQYQVTPFTTFTWEVFAGSSSYTLEINTGQDFTNPQYSYTTSGTTFTVPKMLNENSQYWWRVKGDNSQWSDTWNFITGMSPIPRLLEPKNGYAEVPANNAFLRWNWVDNAASYRVEVSGDPNFSSILFEQEDNNTMMWLPQLSEGMTYYWKVRAYANNVWSDWSEVRNFTVHTIQIIIPNYKYSSIDYSLAGDNNTSFRGSLAGDVRGDGVQRIILGKGKNGRLVFFRYQNGTIIPEDSIQIVASPQSFTNVIPKAIGDVDGDGMNEIIVLSSGISIQYQPNLFQIFKWNGTTYQEVMRKQEDNFNVIDQSTIMISNLDLSGVNEIIMPVNGRLSVYRYSTNSLTKVSELNENVEQKFAIGNCDNDPQVEIVISQVIYPEGNPVKLFVLGFDGTVLFQKAEIPGFEYPLGGVSVKDLNRDGIGEIICSTGQYLAYVYNSYIIHFNSVNYEIDRTDRIKSGITKSKMGDIDGDGDKEIVMSRNANGSYVVDYENGNYILGFVNHTGTVDDGDLSDIDSDGSDEILASSYGAFQIVNIFNQSQQVLLISPLSGPNFESTTPQFVWQPFSGASNYTLQINIGSDFTNPLFNYNVTGTSFIPTVPLNSSTTYSWRVKANNSGWSDIWVFNTIENNNSALLNGFSSGSQIRVTDDNPINPSANPNAYKVNGTAITVEAWVYPLSYPDPQFGNTIFARALNTTSSDPWQSYRLWISNSNGFAQPAFSISSGIPGSEVTTLSPDVLPTFQWTHLAGTFDGSSLKIYVNGVLKSTVQTNITINSEPGVGLYLGRFLKDCFKGAIDDVRLWNICRSETEIVSNMLRELQGDESGLAGYWNLNSISSLNQKNIVYDKTLNHNDLEALNLTKIINFNPLTTYNIPTYYVNPTSINLGTLEQNSRSSIQSITLTNTGTGPLIGQIFSVSNNIIFSLLIPPFFIEPGKTLNYSYPFVPISSGSLNEIFQLQTNASTQSQILVSCNSIPQVCFDLNNISMWICRNGNFATKGSSSSSPGLEWPKGSGKNAVYSSGIWIGAEVEGSVRTATSFYRSEFAPGPIASDPNDLRYRVYKIQKGDNAGNNPDYADWPTTLGAPVNTDGSPQIIGEQTLFSVYNDLDEANHFLGSQPLGAEVQQTVFGFNQSGTLSNTVFLRFKIINKSSNTWNNTYISLWSDPDLGNVYDDLIGIDTTKNLGFVYNGSNEDQIYGTSPPSAGYQILKGAFFTKPIQAFSYFTSGAPPPKLDPNTSLGAYNFMKGKWSDGSSYIDPMTNLPTSFALTGDPVNNQGWVDSYPADRRFLFSTGPLNMEPGQSKEIIAAIILGQGSSNLNSITVLKVASNEIQNLFDTGQIFGGALENVATVTVPEGTTSSLDDLSNSGAQITVTAGSGGVIVEAASYVAPPPGVQTITSPSIAGVGKYLEVDVQGIVSWPIPIRIYYTRNDLLQAGVVESDIQGINYWQGLTNQWNLFSNSGSDDQGRGPSTTWVDTTNIKINGVNYEGFAAANAYHLTQMIIAAKKKSITERYNFATQFIQSLPDDAFKKPADTRRKQLVKMLDQSKSKYDSGNLKSAAQYLEQNVLNHLTSDGKSNNDLWVTNTTSCKTLIRMINEIIDVLLRPQVLGKNVEGNMNVADHVEIPTEYGLSQNYPNPFNPITRIQFGLPENVHTKLIIYDILGREIATLLNSDLGAGYHEVEFNGSNLPSGIYIYRIQAGEFTSVKKMILMK